MTLFGYDARAIPRYSYHSAIRHTPLAATDQIPMRTASQTSRISKK